MIPFGLRNAGASYQQAMTLIFHDYMHKILEDYVDCIIAKSVKHEEHVPTLRHNFERMGKYNMCPNP